MTICALRVRVTVRLAARPTVHVIEFAAQSRRRANRFRHTGGVRNGNQELILAKGYFIKSIGFAGYQRPSSRPACPKNLPPGDQAGIPIMSEIRQSAAVLWCTC